MFKAWFSRVISVVGGWLDCTEGFPYLGNSVIPKDKSSHVTFLVLPSPFNTRQWIEKSYTILT